ncbi:MAG: hypothetical protein AB8B91_17870 [Rubripirellula sp.]
MSEFFVRTDQSVAGPFSGVELREATLAGIIRYEAVIGGTKQGPWYKACDIGLFSEKKTPLPHPPGTTIPIYAVRGMPGPFHGPFKLRELIGFAARGLLPPDALLQAAESAEWIPAKRFRMLAACLSGQLVLIDAAGNVVVRSNVDAFRQKESGAGRSASDEADARDDSAERHRVLEEARAPIEIAKAVDETDLESTKERWRDTPTESQERPKSHASQRVVSEQELAKSPSRLSVAFAALDLRDRLNRAGESVFQRRFAVPVACVLLAVLGVGSAFSYWKQIEMPRAQVIGKWIDASVEPDGEPRFGIEFTPEGQCIVFNSQGRSWSGDFDWGRGAIDQVGFANMEAGSSVIDQLDPAHHAGTVDATDGYISLKGFVKNPPMIDGHEVRDFFVRRKGADLAIGYPTSVQWSATSKTLEAGWISAKPLSLQRPDVVAELSAIEEEFPVPVADFGGLKPLHISAALTAAKTGVPTTVNGENATLHASLAYSNQVNAAYLLAHFGIPDEARSIYRFEIPDLHQGPLFEGAQVVTYGQWKFVLTQSGKLLYVQMLSVA